MTRKSAIVVSLVVALAACWASRAGAEGAFMRLTPLPGDITKCCVRGRLKKAAYFGTK